MHKRGICRHPVSVRSSVTFVSCAKTNKDILPLNGGVECKGGYEKMTIFDQYLALSEKRLLLDGHIQRDNL